MIFLSLSFPPLLFSFPGTQSVGLSISLATLALFSYSQLFANGQELFGGAGGIAMSKLPIFIGSVFLEAPWETATIHPSSIKAVSKKGVSLQEDR